MQVGMVFALIFAVILIGFVLAIGVPQLGALTSVGSQAQVQKAIHDIEDVVDNVYWNGAYGSSDILELALPSGTRVCFIDTDNPSTASYMEEWKRWKSDPAINAIIQAEENRFNLWYFYGSDQNGYKVSHMKLDVNSDNFCAIGGVGIYFENKRDHVAVSLME